MSHAYAISRFEQGLQRALQRVRLVLEAEKHPRLAGDVHHRYADKYLLADRLTNAACASQVNCLSELGLTRAHVEQLGQWSQTSAVSLRFRREERWAFDREETREVESPTKHVLEIEGGGLPQASLTSKVVTKVTDYFWKLDSRWELLAVKGVGSGPEDKVTILERAIVEEVQGGTKTHPPDETLNKELEVNVSWLFRHLGGDTATPTFRIDLDNARCKTPRRNPEIEAAIAHFAAFQHWAAEVAGHLRQVYGRRPDPLLNPGSWTSEHVLVPVLPLLEDTEPLAAGSPADVDLLDVDASMAGAADTSQAAALALLPAGSEVEAPSALLRYTDTNRLLQEEVRALHERRATVAGSFPGGDAKVFSGVEAVLIMVLQHSVETCRQYAAAIDYIEDLLRKQLVAAIGKEVSPADFAEYMRFHGRRLFAAPFAPAPFCLAVRRSEHHSPEGTVSLEQLSGSGISEPIVTLSACGSSPQPMQFALGASSSVTFGGERHLHAWLQHRFSGDAGASLSLVSRARQFSSMIVLVGRIVSATVFDPKYAAIVQNKDELTVPLELSTIPTPKEFKDAVASLSPEQQSFAKAFRAMQLESTLFGIVVIQIKPQLERVLNLTDDSLTKEIKLTQDLMELFIKYQIPSDLLSYDPHSAASSWTTVGENPSSSEEKLTAVKGHVKAMQDMIQQAKQEEIEERRRQAEYARPSISANSSSVYGDLEDRCVMECAVADSWQDECEAFAEDCDTFEAEGDRGFLVRSSSPRGSAPPSAAPTPRLSKEAAPEAAATPAAAASRPPAKENPTVSAGGGGAGPVFAGARDYTQVPRDLDRRFEQLDPTAAVRPTIINPGDVWTRRRQISLLTSPTTSQLGSDEQKSEKDAAFDLLDALTKSGALPIEHAALHVVVAATHCFDKTVTETVVQDNINPIEKVERSMLIMGSTVYQRPAAELIQEGQQERIRGVSPMLFLSDGSA